MGESPFKKRDIKLCMQVILLAFYDSGILVLNILLLQWDFILLEVTFYYAFQKKASRVPWQQWKTLHLFIVVAAVVDEGNEVTSFVKNCTTIQIEFTTTCFLL